MSEGKPTQLNVDDIPFVAGGSNFSCEDALVVLAHLSESYEHLVNFSSYVIERVANAIAASNQ
jgi:hypothetical protein